MTTEMRPFVYKDADSVWFARMPKRTPAKARSLLKTALVARGIVEPDAEVLVEYRGREDFGTYLYQTLNRYPPMRPLSGSAGWGRDLQGGDTVRITRETASAHHLALGSLATVRYVTVDDDGRYRIYVYGTLVSGRTMPQFVYPEECEPIRLT
jgi:hypothetical protein